MAEQQTAFVEVLFVDVDDTLVRWCPAGCEHGTHPYGGEAEGYVIDQAVVGYAKGWRDSHPRGLVVVWSGGGVDYAETWKRRAMDWADGALAKMPVDFPAGRVTYIDDSPDERWAKAGSTVIDPRSLGVPG